MRRTLSEFFGALRHFLPDLDLLDHPSSLGHHRLLDRLPHLKRSFLERLRLLGGTRRTIDRMALYAGMLLAQIHIFSGEIREGAGCIAWKLRAWRDQLH